MIRVRYKDLSAGLHGKAEHCAGGVTVYLLPGLTGSQRRAALRRLRQEASRGCGPALPVPQLTVALGWDQVRTVFRNATAVVRVHPAASLLPAAAAGALMALFVLASVSVSAAAPQAVSGGPAAGGFPARAALGPEGSGGQRMPSWSVAATSRSWAGGRGFGSGARPGFRSGTGPGLGAPIRMSIAVPSP